MKRTGNNGGSAAHTMLVPGPGGWERWRLSPKAGEPAVCEAQVEQLPAEGELTASLALPARWVFSQPVWLHTQDNSLISDMVGLHLEKAGVEGAGEGGVAWSVRQRTADKTLVWALKLAPELPPPAAQAPFRDYRVAAELRAPAADGFYLWRELGRWVLGVALGGKFCHVQALTVRQPGAAMAQELRLMWLRCSAERLVEGVSRLVVWTDGGGADAVVPVMRGFLGWEVAGAPLPPPVAAAEQAALRPVAVAQRMAEEARKRLVRRTVAGVVALVLLVCAGLGGHLFFLHRTNAALKREVAAHAADVARLRQAAALWGQMEPAFETRRFPLQLLMAINELLPPEGVRLTRFSYDGYVLDLAGVALNRPVAVEFTEKLSKHGMLADYEVRSEPPQQIPGGLASFNFNARHPDTPNEK